MEIELATKFASRDSLTEVPINYRARVGKRKLSTWESGILAAAFALGRRYNPILIYSGLASLSILPAAAIVGWVAAKQLTTRVWHSGVALVGTMFPTHRNPSIHPSQHTHTHKTNQTTRLIVRTEEE